MDRNMTVYKVKYEGVAYVYADNPEEAIEFFEDDVFAHRKDKVIKAEITTERIDCDILY